MPRTNPEPPDLRQQHGRLRWARENAGYSSPRDAAEVLGEDVLGNKNTYKSHEFGVRQKEGLKTKHIRRYARAFGVSEEWLATGRGSPKLSPEDSEWKNLSREERERALRLLKASG